MSLSGFKVVHDSVISRQDYESELSGWQDLGQSLFEVSNLQVKSCGDNSTFIDSSVELNDNLAISLIINDFEFINVT